MSACPPHALPRDHIWWLLDTLMVATESQRLASRSSRRSFAVGMVVWAVGDGESGRTMGVMQKRRHAELNYHLLVHARHRRTPDMLESDSTVSLSGSPRCVWCSIWHLKTFHLISTTPSLSAAVVTSLSCSSINNTIRCLHGMRPFFIILLHLCLQSAPLPAI